MNNVISTLLMLVAFSASQMICAGSHKINMILGEHRSLEIPEADKINVSRKGIIYLIETPEKTWDVIALRPGLVVIEAVKNTSKVFQQIIEVRPKEKQEKNLSVFRDVEHPNSSHHEELKEGKNYHVFGKIVLISLSSLAEFGVPSGYGETPGTLISQEKNIIQKLQAMIVAQDAHILGEPYIQLKDGVMGEVKSGGEIMFVAPSSQDKETGKLVWRDFGVKMEAQVDTLDDKFVRVKADVLLRNHNPASREGSFAINKIKTEMLADLGKDFIAGSSSFSTDSKIAKSIPILSDIPIIGPLFGHKMDNHLNSKVFLWLRIDEVTPQLEIKREEQLRPIDSSAIQNKFTDDSRNQIPDKDD